MTDEELKNAIRAHRPELPVGFETRMDAEMNHIMNQKKNRIPRKSMIIAFVMIACLMVGGLVSFAGGVDQRVLTIPAVLDKDAHLETVTDYTDNTVCAVGLSLRELDPSLTDKWYHVVPVDLTVQGRQTFRLVAANMYYIGECYVDVAGDSVTVTYATYKGRLTRKSERLAWFTDPGDITTEYLENPIGKFAFGEKVSISESLKGSRTALLFICNRVSYKNPFNDKGDSLVRYWPNIEGWKEYRSGLSVLMTRLEEENRLRAEEAARAAEEAARAAEEEAHASEQGTGIASEATDTPEIR